MISVLPVLLVSHLSMLFVRWASHGLEFLLVACEPRFLATLTSQQFNVSLSLRTIIVLIYDNIRKYLCCLVTTVQFGFK